MLCVGVKRRLAWTNLARAAPVEKIVKGDHFQTCLGAAEGKAHETPVAAIQPVVIAPTVRQLRNVIAGTLEFGCGYNPNENHAHSTATSVFRVLIPARRPSFMHYQQFVSGE
jgi:hypothetical protein